MKTHPMLFNTEMVKALMAGNKVQTRRPVRHQPFYSTEIIPSWVFPRTKAEAEKGGCGLLFPNAKDHVLKLSGIEIGDLIYVRETYTIKPAMEYGEAGDPAYKADGYYSADKWTPSIHMPREYSRLTLKVTGVRIERVRDISSLDARHEGFLNTKTENGTIGPKDKFKETWQNTYGDSWANNDWVWVIDFEVIHQNVDHYLAAQEGAA